MELYDLFPFFTITKSIPVICKEPQKLFHVSQNTVYVLFHISMYSFVTMLHVPD
jgi:hypothetical protein